MNIDVSQLIPVGRMTGDDDEDTGLLRQGYDQAASFLRGFAWCHDIKDAYLGIGIGGVVAVFLFRIEADPDVDEWLWVVVGDLPTAYLVADNANTPLEALEVYCVLMSEWVSTVRSGGSLGEVFPVPVPATAENADALAKRIDFLRKEIIPMFE